MNMRRPPVPAWHPSHGKSVCSGFCHQILHRHLIANIVAMHDMYRKSKLERGAQGMAPITSPQCITAFARCMRRGYGSSKRFGTIMTVETMQIFNLFAVFEVEASAQLRHNCRLINLDIGAMAG